MGTLIKYRPGVNDDEIVRLCESLDEMYRDSEAVERKSTWRKWFDDDLRKTALDHRGRP